jgi:hypothetical protein
MAEVSDNLKKGFSDALLSPFKAASDIGDKVKTALSGTPKAPDTTWHDQKVKEANASFTPKPTAPKAAPVKAGPKIPKYHTGTDYVPKTGPAILKKGEAVLDTHEAAEHRATKGKNMKHGMENVAAELGGKSEKPKKEIKEIRTRKGKSGGYIHEHHHTAPEHHPMEEHTSPDQDAMVSHLMEHMGQPNPGEAEADAGQGGVPAAGAAQAAPAPAV